jgi:hypothetical protein
MYTKKETPPAKILCESESEIEGEVLHLIIFALAIVLCQLCVINRGLDLTKLQQQATAACTAASTASAAAIASASKG